MAAPTVNAQAAIDAYLQSALADSDAFGDLADLLLTENDSDMAGVLSSIESAGGTQDPAIYWALQMALADRFGTPKPIIADQTVAQQARQIYRQYGQGLRDYVDAVHTATQDYFGDYGIESVTGYHGLNYPQAPDNLHFDMAAREANMQLSGITVYSQDPASVIQAALASQTGLTPNLAHVIAAQQVPTEDLWGILGDGSLRVLPSASDQPSLYLGWENDSPLDTWAPDPSIVSGLLEGPPDALGGESGAPPPPSGKTGPTGSESPPGDIYQQTWDYRQQLLDGVASAQQTLSDFYLPSLDAINAQMMALAKKIYDAQINGQEVDPMWLARETDLAKLYVDIEDRLSQAGQQASDALNDAANQAAQLGADAGVAQLNSLIPNLGALLAKAGVDSLFGQPSEQALQNMVGAGQDPNSPLNMAFAAMGQAAIDLIKHGLFNGLALGQNPLTVAGDLAGQVNDLTLSRANAIARNEMLRAYRTANLMSFQENGDVVDGWVWVAALSTNTCAFCWAENGGFHSNDETLDSHVSCACVMVPVTGDWSSVLSGLEEAGMDESDLEELGISFDEIEDTSVQVPSGEEIFAKQPPDVQQKVLGPGKYALYQNGDLALSDLIGHEHDEQWGGIGYEKSLKDLGFTADDIAAAKAALEAKAQEVAKAPEEVTKTVTPATPNQLAEEAYQRAKAIEDQALAAQAEAQKAKLAAMSPLQRIAEWLKAKFKMTEADRAWRVEMDAIDKRLLAARLAEQKLQRGAGPLTSEVEAANKRLLEERYQEAKAARGVNPLTAEVQRIEAEQRNQRLQSFKDHGPAFAQVASQPREPLVPLAVKKFETYSLTPEDKAFAANIREQIGPEGVLDHEQAIEIGRQIQERIASQTDETLRWSQEFDDIRSASPHLTEQQKAWINGDKEAMAAHGGVSPFDAPSAYQADYRAKTVAYLQEIRGDEGGLGGENLRLAAGDEYVASQLQEAAKLLPSDWIKASNDLGEITPSRNKATNSDGWFLQDNSFEKGDAEIALSYSKNRDELAVQDVALHELIHRMEVAVPQLSRLEQDFYQRRTAGDDYTKLTNGIGLKTKLDKWLDQYLGAEPLVTLRPEYHNPVTGYPSRTAVNYELLTNGVQMAMGHVAEAGKFAQDREFERFVLGSLAGVKARPEITPVVKEHAPAPGEPGGGPALKPRQIPSNPEPFHALQTPVKPTPEEQAQGLIVRSSPKKAPPEPLDIPPKVSLDLTPKDELAAEGKKLAKVFDNSNSKETIVDSKKRIQKDIGERVAGDADWEKLKEHLKPQATDGSDAAAMRVLTDGWGFGFGGKISNALRIAANEEFGLGDAHNIIAKKQFDAAMAEFGDYMPGLRKVVRAMYDATQDYFKANGITEVNIYRGASFVDPPAGLNFDDLNGQYRQVDMSLLPMSPFTFDPQMASTFSVSGVGASGHAQHHLVIGARIPVSEIMSTAWTGFGSKAESEMIFVGGKAKMWGTAVEGAGKSVPAEQIRGMLAEEPGKYPRTYPEEQGAKPKGTKEEGAPKPTPKVKAGEVTVPTVKKEPPPKPPKPKTPAQIAKEQKAAELAKATAATKVEQTGKKVTITDQQGRKIDVEYDAENGGYKVTLHGNFDYTQTGKTLVQANKIVEGYTGGVKGLVQKEMLPEPPPKKTAAEIKAQGKAAKYAEMGYHTNEDGSVTITKEDTTYSGFHGKRRYTISPDTKLGGYKIKIESLDPATGELLSEPTIYTQQSLSFINTLVFGYSGKEFNFKAEDLPETSPKKSAAETKAIQQAEATKVEPGKVTLTVPEGMWAAGTQYTVEPDENLGGYKVTWLSTSGATHTYEGQSLKQVNSYVKGQTGLSVLTEGQLEPGPPKTAAEKKAYLTEKAAKQAAEYAAQHAAQLAAYLHQQYEALPEGQNAIETKAANFIKYELENGAKVSVKKIPGEGEAKPTYQVIISNHPTLPDSTKIVDTLPKVNKALEEAGVTNKAKAASFHGVDTSVPIYGHYQSSPIASVYQQKAEKKLGQYSAEIKPPGANAEQTKVQIIGKPDGTVDLKFSSSAYDDMLGVTAEEAKARLTEMKVKDPALLHFVDAAAHDVAHYSGKITPEEKERIAQVEARRAELDDKFGDYTKAEAQKLTGQIRDEYDKALGQAISAHLGGGAGTHLSVSSIVKKIKNAIASTPEAKRAIAEDLITRLREVTEWSLLHDPRVTREGTIRLFHGSNGGSGENIEVWVRRLAEFTRRGTPFSSDYNVSKSFSGQSTKEKANLLISAQVPVENVLTWYGIRNDVQFQSEYEYTLGDGKIYDYMIINANDGTILFDTEPVAGEKLAYQEDQSGDLTQAAS